MILVIDNQDGSKKQIVVPDNAREMTAEDEKYFLALQTQKQDALEKSNRIFQLREEIMTAERSIADYKRKLSNSDYKLFKHLEGKLTSEEYAPIAVDRDSWRTQINALEEEVATKEAEIEALRR